MIKVTELQIGDWVFAYGHVRRVEIIYGNGDIQADCVELSEDEFEPVPLTPDMLLTNGFERQEMGGDRVAIWTGFGEDNCHDIEVEFDGDKPIHLKIDGPVYLVTPNIKYLHQLQHFLRDCETGKEIKL